MDHQLIKGYISNLIIHKGYGFIIGEDNESHFFHATALVDQEINELIVGEQVQFRILPGRDNRTQAGMVKTLER